MDTFVFFESGDDELILMDTNAKYTYVGVVVVFFTIAIVITALWLSEATVDRESDRYIVYFREHSLDGLQVDSYVTMKGTKVGSVRDLQIAPQNIEQVRVVLNLQKGTPVKTDTRAVLNRNLLTGLAVVDLVQSSQDSSLLMGVPEGEPYPVIPEGRSRLETITSSLPMMLNDISRAVAQVEQVLSEENRRSVRTILVNVETFTGVLARNEKKIDMILDQTVHLSEELLKTTRSFNRVIGKVDREIEELNSHLESGLKGLSELIQSLRATTQEISASVSGSARIIAQDLTQLAQNVSEAVRAFAATAEGYENPRAVIFGPSEKSFGPGESARESAGGSQKAK